MTDSSALVRFQPERNEVMLVPATAVGVQKSQLRQYSRWMDDQRLHWTVPHLDRYRDYLLTERSLLSSSVQAHLSTIRTRYRQLIRDRDLLYSLTPDAAADVLSRKAFVDELVTRLQNAIDPEVARVQTVTVQDAPDEVGLRLTPKQVDDLLYQPGIDTNRNRRDTALMALMVCTGLREGEIVALRVQDLAQSFGGEAAIVVRFGKGKKQRVVPYGNLRWALDIVNLWMQHAAIHEGYVFRRVFSNDRVSESKPITTRSIELILHQYPVWIDPRWVSVRPHDLRRTYARNLYDNGMDPMRIMQNLGHSSLETTLRYIGTISAAERRPPALYAAPAHILEALESLSGLGNEEDADVHP